ncbi:MAG: type III-B CRISPR module-associated protein Cmr5 [Myxococcota bacterium]
MRAQAWSLGAHAKVKAQRGLPDAAAYRTLALKMPTLLHQSGPVQAITFVLSRGGAAGKVFADDLAKVAEHGDGAALLKVVQEAELAPYMALSTQLIDIAAWFRRYAQIELESKP